MTVDEAISRMMPSHIEDKAFAGLNKTPNRIELSLPWPDSRLSPNARVHWASKSKAVKIARTAAQVLTRQAIGIRKPHWSGAALEWVFHPKTRHAQDEDNIIASLKASTDGIADALGIDDSKFKSTYRMAEPVKGGSIIIHIRGIE